MSEESRWKMLHLLNSTHRPSLGYDELYQAGIDCYNDTIQMLEMMGLVQRPAPQQYALTGAATAMLNSFLVGNRRWPSTDIRVDYPQVFVIMPFSQPWSATVYDQMIRVAIEANGLVCVRGDTPVRVGDLMRTVWDAILTAGLIVAEVSALNANVFYELGLAHALGKDTFILKQKGSTVPADFGGAHYYEYDLGDLPGARKLLQDEIAHWTQQNHVGGVGALYGGDRQIVPTGA